MKKMLSLLLTLAMLVGMLPAALAEATHTPYVPGDLTRALFDGTGTNGTAVCADLGCTLEIDAEKLGLSEEEAKMFAMIQEVMENAQITVAGAVAENGVMLELGGTYAKDEQTVELSVQLTLGKDGIELVSESLFPGERITIQWETLLSMAGLSEDEISGILALRDMTPEDIEAMISSLMEEYLPIITQAAAPYGEILMNFVAGLPMTDGPADNALFTGATKMTKVSITDKAVGDMIIALADQLEKDETLAPYLTMLLEQAAEAGEDPMTIAGLCAAIREEAAKLNDEAHPLNLLVATDDNDVFQCFTLTKDSADGSSFSFDAGLSAADTVLTVLHIADSDGSAADLRLAIAYTEDAADPSVISLVVNGSFEADGQTLFSTVFSMDTKPYITEDSMSGYTSTVEYTFDVADDEEPVSMRTSVTANTALTPDGGEFTTSSGVTTVTAGNETMESTAQVMTSAAPGENGPEYIYTEIISMPEAGLSQLGVAAYVHTKPYVPDASLKALALEAASQEDMEAFTMRVMGNGFTALGTLMEMLPQELVDMLTGEEAQAIEEAVEETAEEVQEVPAA